jgi:hypothetical protein
MLKAAEGLPKPFESPGSKLTPRGGRRWVRGLLGLGGAWWSSSVYPVKEFDDLLPLRDLHAFRTS